MSQASPETSSSAQDEERRMDEALGTSPHETSDETVISKNDHSPVQADEDEGLKQESVEDAAPLPTEEHEEGALVTTMDDTELVRMAVKTCMTLGLCKFASRRQFRNMVGLSTHMDDTRTVEWCDSKLLVEQVEDSIAPSSLAQLGNATWWLAERVTGPFVWTAQSAVGVASWVLPLSSYTSAESPQKSTDKSSTQEEPKSPTNCSPTAPMPKTYQFHIDGDEGMFCAGEEPVGEVPDDHDVIFIPAVQKMVEALVVHQESVPALKSVFTVSQWSDLLLQELKIRNPDVVTEFLLRQSGVLMPITDPTSDGNNGFLFSTDSSVKQEDAVVIFRFKNLHETMRRAILQWENELEELKEFSESTVEEPNPSQSSRAQHLQEALDANMLFKMELDKHLRRLSSPFAPAVTGGFAQLAQYINDFLEHFPGEWPQTSMFEGDEPFIHHDD